MRMKRDWALKPWGQPSIGGIRRGVGIPPPDKVGGLQKWVPNFVQPSSPFSHMKSYVALTVRFCGFLGHPRTHALLGSSSGRDYSSRPWCEPLCGLFCQLPALHTQVYETGKKGTREAGSPLSPSLQEAFLTLLSYTVLSSLEKPGIIHKHIIQCNGSQPPMVLMCFL